MAVAFVNKQDTAFSNGNGWNPTMPGSIVAGNLLVMTAHIEQTAEPTMNTPAGWTQVIDGSVRFGTGTHARLYVYVKKAVTSEPSPTMTATGNYFGYFLVEQYSGQDPTTPLDGTASLGTADADASVNTPGITTAHNNSLVLYVYADEQGASNTITPPAGTTTRHDVADGGTGFRITASEILKVSAGSVAATNHGRTATSLSAVAATLAISAPISTTYNVSLTGTATATGAVTAVLALAPGTLHLSPRTPGSLTLVPGSPGSLTLAPR